MISEGNFILVVIALLGLLSIAAFLVFLFYKKVRTTEVEVEKKKRLNANLLAITREANDIILVIDIVKGNIYEGNNKACEILGYKEEELLNKSIFDLFPASALDRSSEVIVDVWEKKGLVFQDLPFVDYQGNLIEVECSAKVLPYNDRPAIVIYAREIADRLKLERKIKVQTNKILDSIRYAERLQKAILPPCTSIKNSFKDFFVLYLPKDIVSGDFYWYAEDGNNKYLAVIDCTGHGVPGAFLSMLGNSSLRSAFYEYNLRKPSEILAKLNELVVEILNQNEKSVKDGMDISLIKIDVGTNKVEFAGANNPLMIVASSPRNIENAKEMETSDGFLYEVKASKRPIGYSKSTVEFQNHTLEIQEGDTLYLTTDGYADQFGGESGMKFMKKRLKQKMIETSKKPINSQHDIFKEIHLDWKKDTDQLDDICLMGIRV